MVRTIAFVTATSLVLASCGTVRESRFNPLNWFGGSVSEPVAAEGVNPLIPRRRTSILERAPETYSGTRVAEVTELLVERRPGGAVIRATGVAAYNGPYDVRMTQIDSENTGELTYELSARQVAGASGAAVSRTVTAGVFVSDQDLAGINTVRVIGQSNARSARR